MSFGGGASFPFILSGFRWDDTHYNSLLICGAAETTLSASPRLTPRISTSSANMVGGDVWRVVQQCPLASPNMALIGAGVG